MAYRIIFSLKSDKFNDNRIIPPQRFNEITENLASNIRRADNIDSGNVFLVAKNISSLEIEITLVNATFPHQNEELAKKMHHDFTEILTNMGLDNIYYLRSIILVPSETVDQINHVVNVIEDEQKSVDTSDNHAITPLMNITDTIH